MLILIILIFLSIIICSNGFADWLASQYCDRPLVAGEVIMNQEVELSNDRTILVYRDGIEIKSGDEYILGEKLTISITELKKTNQYMFESSTNAKFEGGGCDGIRSAKTKPTLILPSIMSANSDNKVTIVSGWAYGHETVYITEPFILNPPGTNEKVAEKDEVHVDTIKANVPSSHKNAAGIPSKPLSDAAGIPSKPLSARDKFKDSRNRKKTTGSTPSRGKASIKDSSNQDTPSVNKTKTNEFERSHDDEIAIKTNTLKKSRATLKEGIGNEDTNEPKAAKEKLTEILSKTKSGIADHWKKIKNDIKSSTGIKNTETKKAAKKAKKEKRRSRHRSKLRGGSTDHSTVVSFVEYTFVIAAISYIGYKIVKDRFKLFRYYLRLRGRNVDK
jgi:hypothetical protein